MTRPLCDTLVYIYTCIHTHTFRLLATFLWGVNTIRVLQNVGLYIRIFVKQRIQYLFVGRPTLNVGFIFEFKGKGKDRPRTGHAAQRGRTYVALLFL